MHAGVSIRGRPATCGYGSALVREAAGRLDGPGRGLRLLRGAARADRAVRAQADRSRAGCAPVLRDRDDARRVCDRAPRAGP